MAQTPKDVAHFTFFLRFLIGDIKFWAYEQPLGAIFGWKGCLRGRRLCDGGLRDANFKGSGTHSFSPHPLALMSQNLTGPGLEHILTQQQKWAAREFDANESERRI